MLSDLQKSDRLELDLNCYQLRRGGTTLRLEKIPMELLIFLVEHKDRLVTREEIIERIWGREVFLDTEQGINTAVRKIRLTLRDKAEQPRYLLTVVGKGYRFIGQITVTADKSGSGTKASKEFRPPLQGPVASLPQFSPPRLRLIIPLIAVSVLVLLGASILKTDIFGRRRQVLKQALPIHSVAVLPLENLSGDPGQEYLADGFTDELITHLAKLGSLKVISRTSVMRYKLTKKSLREIAGELDVDGIVEGSVARFGNKVRVTVQLLRAANDEHLWAEDYQRDVGDLLDLQREIARTIAHQVALNLNPEQQAYFALQYSHDPELNEAYLRGLFFWERRTEGDLHRAIENFKLAISRDPGFAPAYAGVANSYNLLWYLGFMKADHAVPPARDATEKALALDPSSAEAHVALSYLKLHYDWDWSGAEKESRLAVELRPGYSLAHQWFAYYLRSVGRFDEALAENERARELDPLSEIKTLGVATAYARKHDDARCSTLIHRAMEINPSDSVPHYVLSDLLQKEGRTLEAASEFRTAIQFDGNSPLATLFDDTLRKSDLQRAKRAVTETVIARLTMRSKTTYVSPRDFVEQYLQINDNKNALHWLDLAFVEHSSFLVQIGEDPLYDGLRTDPRFHSMLKRMRFPAAD